MDREIETNIDTDFYERCPYCNEVHLFKAVNEGSDSYLEKITTMETTKKGGQKEVTRTYLVSRCENTGKLVYFWFQVTQSGNLLTCVKNLTTVHFFSNKKSEKMKIKTENQTPEQKPTMRLPPPKNEVKKQVPPKPRVLLILQKLRYFTALRVFFSMNNW
jgi:hypothetical protein